jgi:sucrose-phosphate synthase
MTERVLVSDIDGTLLREEEPTAGLQTLRRMIEQHGDEIRLIYATGRTAESALGLVEEGVLPTPQALATLVGTEIWLPDWTRPVSDYRTWIEGNWEPDHIERVVQEFKELDRQPDEFQSRHKLSFFTDRAALVHELETRLLEERLSCTVIHSGGRYLDLIPARAGKRSAVEFILRRWGVEDATVLAAGDSLNDRDMLEAPAFYSVIVGNADDDLVEKTEGPKLHEAQLPFAAGVLEGAEVFDFWER